MALTREFRESVAERARKDAKYRKALLKEAIEALLNSELEAGKAMLRDYINATIGFEELSRILHKDSKSIHRMLGLKGNPRAENIFSIIKALQDADNFNLHVKVGKEIAA